MLKYAVSKYVLLVSHNPITMAKTNSCNDQHVTVHTAVFIAITLTPQESLSPISSTNLTL